MAGVASNAPPTNSSTTRRIYLPSWPARPSWKQLWVSWRPEIDGSQPGGAGDARDIVSSPPQTNAAHQSRVCVHSIVGCGLWWCYSISLHRRGLPLARRRFMALSGPAGRKTTARPHAAGPRAVTPVCARGRGGRVSDISYHHICLGSNPITKISTGTNTLFITVGEISAGESQRGACLRPWHDVFGEKGVAPFARVSGEPSSSMTLSHPRLLMAGSHHYRICASCSNWIYLPVDVSCWRR